VEAQPQAATAEEWVGLGRRNEVGDWLVAADVERAHGEPAVAEGIGDRQIGGELFVLIGRLGAIEEEEFGAEQANPVGTMEHRLDGVIARRDVGDDLDRDAVGGDRRSARGLEQSAGVPPLPGRPVVVQLHDVGSGSITTTPSVPSTRIVTPSGI
jgi:hypothetical protein